MLILAVHVTIKAGSEEEVIPSLHKLQEETRREPGCIMYVGHQCTEDPRKFMFYEQYKDHAALEAHRNAPYFKEYVAGGLDTIMERRSRELYTVVE